MINFLNDFFDFVEFDYKIIEKIPISGQRVVYLSEKNISDGKKYMLKYSSAEPYIVSRIEREIRILSEFNSEYFPKVCFNGYITKENLNDFFDSFSLQDDKEKLSKFEVYKALKVSPFFLTVETYIDNIPWDNSFLSSLDQKKIVTFLIQVFEGLSLLWGKKIVHRDLKPGNILIKPCGSPVIIDLGAAKSFRDGTVDLTLPFFSAPITYQFAAPEQFGNETKEVTYKSDQFAMGVIAFFMLTGKFPYGDNQEIGLKEMTSNLAQGKIVNLGLLESTISGQFLDFVKKLIEIEPYKRFRNSKIIIENLNEINKGL